MGGGFFSAAFLAPVIGGPLTSILILFEMAGNYTIILPLLVALVNAMLVAHQFSRHSLYTHKLYEKGTDLVAGREEGSLAAFFFTSKIDDLNLTGERGELAGVVSLTDLRPHLKGVVRRSDLLKGYHKTVLRKREQPPDERSI